MGYTYNPQYSAVYQSGVDEDLSGLLNLTDINVGTLVLGSGSFAKTFYILPNGVHFVVDGTQSINPNAECLVFTGTSHMNCYSAAAVINIGSEINQFGGTYGADDTAIWFTSNAGNAYQAFPSGLIIRYSTWNHYSGKIIAQSCCSLGFLDPNTYEGAGAIGGYIGPEAVYEMRGLSADQPSEANMILIYGKPSLVIDGPVFRGFGSNPSTMVPVFCGTVNYQQTPRVRIEGADGVGYLESDTVTRENTFIKINALQATASPKAITLWTKNRTIARNLPAGSATTITEFNPLNVCAQGYAEVRQDIRFSVTNSDDSAANAVVFMRDTDNGDRKVWDVAGPTIDNTGDKIYIKPTSNGVASWASDSESPVTVIVAHKEAVWGGVDDVGDNKKDYRSLSGTKGADDFKFYIWAYQNRYSEQVVKLASDKIIDVAVKQFPDTNVTRTEAQAGGLASIATLDDFYDAAKYWKTRPIAANIEYPATTSLVATGVGQDIDLGAQNLIVDANASAAFTVNTATSTITIKATTLTGGAKFTSIRTTGTVSIVGSASIDAPYTDASGTKVTVTREGGEAFSARVAVNGAMQNAVFNVTSLPLTLQPTDIVRVAMMGFGTKARVIDTTGAGLVGANTFALEADAAIDTSVPLATLNALSDATSSYINAQGEIGMLIKADMGAYQPNEVLAGLHYWLNNVAGNYFAGLLTTGDASLLAFQRGRVSIKSSAFFVQADDSFGSSATVPDTGIRLPLVVSSDAQGATPVRKNANGIPLATAQWTQQEADVDERAVAQAVWTNDTRTLNGALFE